VIRSANDYLGYHRLSRNFPLYSKTSFLWGTIYVLGHLVYYLCFFFFAIYPVVLHSFMGTSLIWDTG
jgi:hypothetical protein